VHSSCDPNCTAIDWLHCTLSTIAALLRVISIHHLVYQLFNAVTCWKNGRMVIGKSYQLHYNSMLGNHLNYKAWLRVRASAATFVLIYLT
jgi:hypothetical protein